MLDSEGAAVCTVPVVFGEGADCSPPMRTERVVLLWREDEPKLLTQGTQSLWGAVHGGWARTCLAMLLLALACLDQNILVMILS